MRLGATLLASEGLKAMPWLAMDIGSTLTKLVYFEPKNIEPNVDADADVTSKKATKLLHHMHRYLTSNSTYGKSGHRDEHLQMDLVKLHQHCGSLHFIRFQTKHISNFLQQFVAQGMCELVDTICATGGGAHKFEASIRNEFNMKLVKFDELDTLLKGILFAESHNCAECFYFKCTAQRRGTSVRRSLNATKPYPFLLVNIGSGVSLLAVRGPDNFKRVSGSSLGGGTFLGLCSLLTGCKSFEEAIQLATRGDHKRVDKLVRDIYGGEYARFGLPGKLIASSFGKMHLRRKRAAARPADLARATLVTIANNIGSIAHLCAVNERMRSVVFVGNFLRINPIAMELLADAMSYWSRGGMRAVFLQHEGYFGALGCLLSYHAMEAAALLGRGEIK